MENKEKLTKLGEIGAGVGEIAAVPTAKKRGKALPLVLAGLLAVSTGATVINCDTTMNPNNNGNGTDNPEPEPTENSGYNLKFNTINEITPEMY